jgi:NAD-dependent SIR2 family protein deacetylase
LKREDRVVVILGAGATLADGLRKPRASQPPLDQGFFSNVLPQYRVVLAPIAKYMQEHYGAGLCDPGRDSLERVMAILYTDVFGGGLEQEAYDALLTLIRVFVYRLATTTNDIRMTHRSLLYRLVVGFLNDGIPPANITIVTFNQDIQVEKALDVMQMAKHRTGQPIFCFPHCYGLPNHPSPSTPTNPNEPRFDIGPDNAEGITVLKLHGSLNWYSLHNSPTPTKGKLFDPKRKLGITRRKSIKPDMTLDVRPGARATFTFPIIVPPVVHKSGILHQDLKSVWALAEQRLQNADRVIIFGYSCPVNDWESANLLCRVLTNNRRLVEVSVIDPNTAVLHRYVDLGNLSNVSYYRSAARYLRAE